jgi:hypothetical protein
MNSEILIYQNNEGNIAIDVRLETKPFGLHKPNCNSSLASRKLQLANTSKTFLKRGNWIPPELFGNSEQFKLKAIAQ